MAKQKKVRVTGRAVIQRINRKLAPQGERLKSSKGELGFYTIDVRRNFLIDKNIDLAVLARELDVLEQWEVV